MCHTQSSCEPHPSRPWLLGCWLKPPRCSHRGRSRGFPQQWSAAPPDRQGPKAKGCGGRKGCLDISRSPQATRQSTDKIGQSSRNLPRVSAREPKLQLARCPSKAEGFLCPVRPFALVILYCNHPQKMVRQKSQNSDCTSARLGKIYERRHSIAASSEAVECPVCLGGNLLSAQDSTSVNCRGLSPSIHKDFAALHLHPCNST